MMTLPELQNAKINPDVAREAHTQVQKRLQDALVTKADHERKAYSLLAAEVTIALGLFTVFGVLGKAADPSLASAFLFSGLIYFIGAISAALVLWPKTYGVAGSDPSAWLRPGVIDADDKALTHIIAYEVFFHAERIARSVRANRINTWLLISSLGAVLAGSATLGVWMFLGQD